MPREKIEQRNPYLHCNKNLDFTTKTMNRQKRTPNLGERLHNPLNIRYAPQNHWKGLHAKQPEVKGFCHFIDDDHGLRAAIVLLKNYVVRHGLATLEQIIYRWAPPTENDTEIYIACVAGRSGIDRSRRIDISAGSMDLCYLVSAMARQETGMRFVPAHVEMVRQRFGI